MLVHHVVCCRAPQTRLLDNMKRMLLAGLDATLVCSTCVGTVLGATVALNEIMNGKTAHQDASTE